MKNTSGVQTYRIIQWQQLNPVVLVHEEMREMKRKSIVQAYAHMWKQVHFRLVGIGDFFTTLSNWKMLDRSLFQRQAKNNLEVDYKHKCRKIIPP